ncbi:L,D-transpeptidase family protein [Aureimonas sp. AU40]|uniref:L,D-transpeptidase family protein n=1 Tax=Aureimonas sp. AU40 TaxID=1637747 RepID=UPI0009E9FDBC|nr:L,D-transpeptidase [Aureimonas sp. AU40]
MRTSLSVLTAFFLASSAAAFAAPLAPPDLSEGAVNAAVLSDWQGRQEAMKQAEAQPAEPEKTEAKPDASAQPAGNAKTASPDPKDLPDPFLIRLQVLLDRAHASPGVIDGRAGGNTDKAIRAYEDMNDLKGNGQVDEALWKALSKDDAPAVKTYELTREDVDGRYVKDMPSDYAEMAKLDWLGYRDAAEMLAERFHMDEKLLRDLNPGADFTSVGTKLLVTDPGADPEMKVARIVVDKSKGELIAYDKEGGIVLVDPATIGSEDTPSPSGTMKVKGSAREPTYEYNPAKNFQQGKNRKKLTLPAGPNGPVGIVWIDLSKPTYGIHGTPEPSQIDKTASHGCVRLTNWDAQALSRLVLPLQTVVEFKN